MRHSDPLKDKQLTRKCTIFPFLFIPEDAAMKKKIRGLFAWDNDSLPVASCPRPEALRVSHHWCAQVLKCAALLPNNNAGVKIIEFVVPASPLSGVWLVQWSGF